MITCMWNTSKDRELCVAVSTWVNLAEGATYTGANGSCAKIRDKVKQFLSTKKFKKKVGLHIFVWHVQSVPLSLAKHKNQLARAKQCDHSWLTFFFLVTYYGFFFFFFLVELIMVTWWIKKNDDCEDKYMHLPFTWWWYIFTLQRRSIDGIPHALLSPFPHILPLPIIITGCYLLDIGWW